MVTVILLQLEVLLAMTMQCALNQIVYYPHKHLRYPLISLRLFVQLLACLKTEGGTHLEGGTGMSGGQDLLFMPLPSFFRYLVAV